MIKCTNATIYKEDGNLYVDYYGEFDTDFGKAVIHIPKMELSFDALCTTKETNCFTGAIHSCCQVENNNQPIFYELFLDDKEDEFLSGEKPESSPISLSSDNKEWLYKEQLSYESKGYKVTSKAYIDNTYYVDLEK